MRIVDRLSHRVLDIELRLNVDSNAGGVANFAHLWDIDFVIIGLLEVGWGI